MCKTPGNSSKERTEYSIWYEFHSDEPEYTEGVCIWIPFELLIQVVHDWCLGTYEVNIDGKDTAVWNLFSGTNFIDDLFDDIDFVNAVTEAYKNSGYIEDDYNKWLEEKPWEYDEEAYCE